MSEYNSNILIFIGIIFVVIVLIIIATLVVRESSSSQIQFRWNNRPSFEFPLNPRASTDGSVEYQGGSAITDQITCERSDRRSWINNNDGSKCVCNIPFFGPTCENETYDGIHYNFIGDIDSGFLLPPFTQIEADRLSFQSVSTDTVCTGMCDGDDSCIGVTYDTTPNSDHMCTLLHGSISVDNNEQIGIGGDKNLGIYLKKGNSIIFYDRVFVFTNAPPPDMRYWLQDQAITATTIYRAMFYNTITELRFRPKYAINTTGMIGYFHDTDFNISDVPSDPNNPGDGWITQITGSVIKIPDTWTLPIYGVYIRS